MPFQVLGDAKLSQVVAVNYQLVATMLKVCYFVSGSGWGVSWQSNMVLIAFGIGERISWEDQ